MPVLSCRTTLNQTGSYTKSEPSGHLWKPLLLTISPSAVQLIGPSSQTTTTEGAGDDYNQCVFIRYFIRRPRAGLFPRVMKGAAGPQDLGSGQTHDSTFPELTAQSGLGPDIEYDAFSDCEAQSLAPGDDCSEQDTIVDNMPIVRYSPNAHRGP